MSYTIQLRRDTAADWTSANPVLAQGELGIETDTKLGKLGDGSTAWNSLAYWQPSLAWQDDHAVSPDAIPGGTSLLVPLYEYPSPATDWNTLNSLAPPVQYVIANPASGPGSVQDANWLAAIKKARAAGVTVLGYVDTNYNAVSQATVAANIGLWKSLYGVTSIFFDRVSALSADLAYYTLACSTVTGVTVLNHGTIPDAGYANIGNILVVFENQYSAWGAFTPATWMYSYPPSKFCVLVWNCSSGNMPTVMGQVQAFGIGNCLLTDEADDNFTALPGYLAAEAALAGYPAQTWIRPSADTTGAADVVNLQRLLTACKIAGGGYVKGQPGAAYYLDASLVIGSGTTLDMTDCNVTLVSGSNTNLVQNYSAGNPAATGTGAMTSGGSVITTSLGASASVGQSVVIAGAAASGNSPLVGLVSAQTSTTITVTNLDGSALEASATVSGATVNLYNRDSNITIQGGYWHRGSNAGSGTAAHSFLLRHVDTYTVNLQGFTSSAGKYAVNPADCTNGRGSIRGINSASDGWHINGPHYGCVIDLITGSTGDDSFAATGSDYTSFNDSSGNIVGVTVGTIDTVASSGRHFTCVPGTGNLIDGIKVTGQILGIAKAAEGSVYIGDDTASAQTTGGTIGTIDLGTVASAVTTANQLVYLPSPSARHIKVNFDWASTYALLYGVYVGGSSAVTIGHLEVSGDINAANSGSQLEVVRITAPSTPVAKVTFNGFTYTGNSGSGGSLLYLDTGTVNEADFIACTVTYPSVAGSNYWAVLSASSAVCNYFNVIGGTCTNANNLVLDEINNPVTYTLAGGFCMNTAGRVMSLYGNAVKTIVFAGCTVTGLSFAAFYVQTASVVFVGGGLSMSTSYTLYQLSASESVTQAGFSNFLPGTFTAPGTTPSGHWYGSVVTNDITVLPNNPAISASASMFLDNNAGQVFEFFNNSGGTFGVFDKTHSVTLAEYAAGSTTNIYLGSGAFQVLSGNLDIETAGYGLAVKEGSNAKQGTATLSSGSVVVSNTSVTANSRIFLTSNADGGTPGWLRVSARSAGTSFTITSSSGTDSSTVAYEIFEPV